MDKNLPYAWVSRYILKESESGDPTFHRWALLCGSAFCLLIFLQLWFLLSKVDIVRHLSTTKYRGKGQCYSNLASFWSISVSPSSYFFEADFQVVLWLLLIIRKRFIDQKLLFHMDLNKQTNKKKTFCFLHHLISVLTGVVCCQVAVLKYKLKKLT